MRHVYRHICLVSMLLSVLTAQAVQLGSAKGSVVFGRPLDLTMQVRLDAPYDETASCFSADVFQADNKFDAGRVRLDVTPAASGLDATVRVRSVSLVNEPWAKVILRSTCGSKISRQYDFLTDFAAEGPIGSTLAESVLTQPATAIATTSSSALAANSQITSNASNLSSAPNPTAKAPVSNWNVRRTQAKVKTLPQKLNSDIASTLKKVSPATQTVFETKKSTAIVTDALGQSRLKMETFELTDEHQVLLKLSSALTAPTGMRTPEEIQALAQATAVWRAINGVPAEVKAAAVAAAPAPTSALVNPTLAAKNEFPSLVVYGLIGLLAITLGCIAWLWLRVRKASRAGYGWLNDAVSADELDSIEPVHSQLSTANVRMTPSEPQEQLEPMFEEGTEAPEPVAKQGIEVDVKKEKEVAGEEKFKKAVVTSTDHQIVSALPLHFDDPRFDERVLRTHKKPRDLSHNKPIESPTELMDLVLADTPPKLRAVTAPATTAPATTIVATPAAEPIEPIVTLNNTTKTSKPATAKDDSKGNLIDFDVFAEQTPAPADKPSRIAR